MGETRHCDFASSMKHDKKNRIRKYPGRVPGCVQMQQSLRNDYFIRAREEKRMPCSFWVPVSSSSSVLTWGESELFMEHDNKGCDISRWVEMQMIMWSWDVGCGGCSTPTWDSWLSICLVPSYSTKYPLPKMFLSSAFSGANCHLVSLCNTVSWSSLGELRLATESKSEQK